MSEHIEIFDADNHFYETKDALTAFLPEQFKKLVQYVEINGRTKILVNGKLSEYIPNPTFSVVAKPGALEDYYRKGNPEGKSYRELVGDPMRSVPAYQDPAARLELMNEQGLDRTIMFPTLASLIEERLRDDVDAMHVVIHALNEWIHETWGFNYDGLDRIFSTPVITLPIVEKAIEELEWVAERGARAVLIRPAPVPGLRGTRSFALPEFDPFWKRVVELDILVAFHSSDSGYDRYTNDWSGGSGEFLPFQSAAFKSLSMWRPVEDTIASLICHGTFTRHPDLKTAVIENGSSWVGPLLTSLKSAFKKMPQEFGNIDPVEQFKKHVHVSPFWEEDLNELADLIGEDRVLFGSDFPHPEGLADPRSYLEALEHASPERTRKIMGGNLSRLMNIKVPART